MRTPTGGRLVSVVAVTAVLAVLAGACSSSSPKVAVIGDSITWLAATDIQARLTSDGDRLLLTGRIGYTAAQLAPDVTTFARQRPAVVLFEMGTNDVTTGATTPATTLARYEQAMSGYRRQFPQACVIATTVGSHRDDAALDALADQLNAWLVGHFSHLVDWNAYEWHQRQAGHQIVEPDLVHPTTAGQAALANLDQTAVRTCLKQA